MLRYLFLTYGHEIVCLLLRYAGLQLLLSNTGQFYQGCSSYVVLQKNANFYFFSTEQSSSLTPSLSQQGACFISGVLRAQDSMS